MARFRLRETFEGVRWLGDETPEQDVEWLEKLPSGDNNVSSVSFDDGRFKLKTYLTESVAETGDYVAIGANKQPIVMPASMFEERYERADAEQS